MPAVVLKRPVPAGVSSISDRDSNSQVSGNSTSSNVDLASNNNVSNISTTLPSEQKELPADKAKQKDNEPEYGGAEEVIHNFFAHYFLCK
ncbi:unnamed protein product [Toxocara canis]|uniref:Uncharacterized protein n=1 Tax=Toxocara canis TaxID=6265 RepID=A0A183U9W1_TOXCA|nr:unnamed protein product [Toxocara canis]